MKKGTILKVLSGSRAHNLHTKESDYDYRGVFVVPTSVLLSLGTNVKNTQWIEGNIDDTSWEIGKFLMMATKCNPTILETFLAPIAGSAHVPGWEQDLRELFPYVWNSIGVKNAFIGYGLSQRKRFLEKKDSRAPKYAVAYLRSLYNAFELLTTETFSVDMSDTPIYETLKKWKSGDFTVGEVIDLTEFWTTELEEAYEKNPDKKTDLDRVNEFLLKVRKEFWK